LTLEVLPRNKPVEKEENQEKDQEYRGIEEHYVILSFSTTPSTPTDES
jgi:hypothetical protein